MCIGRSMQRQNRKHHQSQSSSSSTSSSSPSPQYTGTWPGAYWCDQSGSCFWWSVNHGSTYCIHLPIRLFSNYASWSQSDDLSLLRRLVLYSGLSLSADWTTAIPFWLVLPKYISSASSQCRMRQSVCYLGLDVTTTSPLFLKPSTGYQFRRGSSSRRWYWCGSASTILLLATWLTSVCQLRPPKVASTCHRRHPLWCHVPGPLHSAHLTWRYKHLDAS